MLTGNVELVVEASYEATVATHWLEAHPSVLLDKVMAALLHTRAALSRVYQPDFGTLLLAREAGDPPESPGQAPLTADGRQQLPKRHQLHPQAQPGPAGRGLQPLPLPQPSAPRQLDAGHVQPHASHAHLVQPDGAQDWAVPAQLPRPRNVSLW